MEVQMASPEGAAEIPQQVGELLGEIMDAAEQKAFNFKFEEVCVAWFHEGDVAVVVGVVRMIGKLTVGDEPFQQLLHDRFGGVVFGELVQVGQGRECFHYEYSFG